MSNKTDAKGGDRGKRLSAFAQSAYQHATRTATPPRNSIVENLTSKIRGKGRSQDARDLFYYADSEVDTTVDGLNTQHISDGIVEAEFQPLAGASIVLITETSDEDQTIMEERENIGCTVESLGARWVPTLDSSAETITHAIWIGADNVPVSKGDTIWKRIASDALNKLSICQSMDIREFYPCACNYVRSSIKSQCAPLFHHISSCC